MKSELREIEQDQRFEFGKNWQKFLALVDEGRIQKAEQSLRMMLELESLSGKSFLDMGSGSGLFSLAAVRLGAQRVHSFDFDPQSVACTLELKRRYFPECEHWTIEEGSVLDPAYLGGLGQFDTVYAWGVLHHTGNMWKALELIAPLVANRGRLFVAVYNDQGRASHFWRTVKSLYNKGPAQRALVASTFVPFFVVRGLVADLMRARNPLRRYREYKKERGMSIVRDWVDWLGGFPFEFAKPEEIFEFYKRKGFSLLKLKTCRSDPGNNEFVFVRCAE